MAFGDAIRADGATVVLHAETGEFNAKIEAAERQWRESTGQMSREALKLSLAQEKLRKALASHGAESASAKRATIALKDAEEQAARAADRTTREYQQQERQLGRLSRGALAGSGAFRGLGRSLAFASAGFLGGAGFVYAVRRAIDAASNLEEQTSKTRRVFGESAQTIIDWSRTTSTSIGIASDQALEAAGSIGNMLTALKVADRPAAEMSRRMVQLAADMASFNNADPTDMLDRIRAGLSGESEPLKKFGTILSETRVKQFAWANGIAKTGEELTEQQKILGRYGLLLQDTRKQHGDFALTSEGLANSQRTLTAVWREANIILGSALAPAMTQVVRGLADWFSKAENQERIQRDVNSAVETGEKVVRGLAGAFRDVKAVLGPVVDLLGGVENAVKLMGLAWVAFKTKAVLSFAATATASATTSAKMVRDATVAGRAWDTATRPRTMLVTTTTTGGVTTTTGGGRSLPGTQGTRGTGAVGVAAIVAGIFGLEALTKPPSLREQQLRIAELARVDRDAAFNRAIQFSDWFGTPLADLTTSRNPYFKRQGVAPLQSPTRAGVSDAASRGGGVDAGREGGQTPARGGGGDAPKPVTEEDLLLNVARARARPGEADDVRALNALKAFYVRKIKALEARRNLTKEQKERLASLYGQLAGVQSELTAIEKSQDDRATKETAIELPKRLQLKRANAERTRKRIDDDLAADRAEVAFWRKVLRERKLTISQRIQVTQELAQAEDELAKDLETVAEKRRARMKANADRVARALRADPQTARINLQGYPVGYRGKRAPDPKKPGSDEDALTVEEMRRMQFEFLQGLQGATNQFGSNIYSAPDVGGGQTATNTYAMVNLMREMVQSTNRLSSGVAHPGAKYARTELSLAFGGVLGV